MRSSFAPAGVLSLEFEPVGKGLQPGAFASSQDARLGVVDKVIGQGRYRRCRCQGIQEVYSVLCRREEGLDADACTIATQALGMY